MDSIYSTKCQSEDGIKIHLENSIIYSIKFCIKYMSSLLAVLTAGKKESYVIMNVEFTKLKNFKISKSQI